MAARDRKPYELEVSHAILRRWHEAVPNDRLAHLVKDATRAFFRALQERLAPYDVPHGSWTFLRVLWERDGLTQRELSIEAGVMEPTTFAALRAMEEAGWVTRRQQAGNRKNVYVFLTARGKALKRTLVPRAEDVNAIAIKGVSATEVAIARRVLLAIIDNLARDELAQAALRRADEVAAARPGPRRSGKVAAPRRPRVASAASTARKGRSTRTGRR